MELLTVVTLSTALPVQVGVLHGVSPISVACLLFTFTLFLQSGARINISEGNCPERIITLAGPTNAIFKAFAMIIDKLEEVSVSSPSVGPGNGQGVPNGFYAS